MTNLLLPNKGDTQNPGGVQSLDPTLRTTSPPKLHLLQLKQLARCLLLVHLAPSEATSLISPETWA